MGAHSAVWGYSIKSLCVKTLPPPVLLWYFDAPLPQSTWTCPASGGWSCRRRWWWWPRTQRSQWSRICTRCGSCHLVPSNGWSWSWSWGWSLEICFDSPVVACPPLFVYRRQLATARPVSAWNLVWRLGPPTICYRILGLPVHLLSLVTLAFSYGLRHAFQPCNNPQPTRPTIMEIF